MTKFYKDDAYEVYTSKEDFKKRIEEVHDSTKWIERETSDLLINLSNTANSQAAIDTNQSGTKLFMIPKGLNLFDEEPLPIRECALGSLYQRLGIGGTLPKHLTPTGVHELCELAIRYMPERRVQIPIVEDKINAFLSKEYNIIDTLEVLDVFDKGIKSLIGEKDIEGFVGTWSYETTSERYLLPIKKTVNEEEYKVVVGVTTSDNGMSGVHIDGFLKGKKETLPLFSKMSVEHRGNTSIENVEENVAMISSSIKSGMTNLARMMGIEVSNPVGCAKRVAEKCCLKKNLALEAIEVNSKPLESALDIFILLAGITSKIEDPRLKVKMEGNVAKMLNINWKEYDLPGDYKW